MELVVRARRARGFSLVEIMIALAVVSIALLGLLSLINSSGLVQDDTRYRTIAYNAAREKIEEMRGRAFLEIFQRYNSSTTDDTAALLLLGTCPGNTFTVDDIPQGVGTITFPEVVKSGVTYLTETPADSLLAQELGMPKDLNRNANTTDDELLDNYSLLPVKVEISWTAVGKKTITLPVITYIGLR